VFLGAALVAAASVLQVGSLRAAALPDRLSDADFWRLITDVSEPDGVFHSENFTSNENAFQLVIPELRRRIEPGGVYVGVGPEQNFTYIVALRPKIAFIVDIRRQNLLQHLLYKALIELSTDRVDFLYRLFSRVPRRPTPAAGASASPVEALLSAVVEAAPDSELFQRNIAAVNDRLLNYHKFPLTAEELERILHVYRQFFEHGPNLSYSFPGATRGVLELFPAYSELMTATDGDGVAHSYVATEAHFQALRQLELDNLIVPICGDFAGPRAIRTIGKYLKEHGATVSAFYTSNVEQYLFQNDSAWKRFFENVRALPTDERSLFIRSIASNVAESSPYGRVRLSLPKLSSIERVLAAFDKGDVTHYADVIGMSR
jgi:hypothetical protein